MLLPPSRLWNTTSSRWWARGPTERGKELEHGGGGADIQSESPLSIMIFMVLVTCRIVFTPLFPSHPSKVGGLRLLPDPHIPRVQVVTAHLDHWQYQTHEFKLYFSIRVSGITRYHDILFYLFAQASLLPCYSNPS